MNLDVIYDLIKPGVTVAHYSMGPDENGVTIRSKFVVGVASVGTAYIRLYNAPSTIVCCDIGDDSRGHKCLLLTEGDVVIWRAA